MTSADSACGNVTHLVCLAAAHEEARIGPLAAPGDGGYRLRAG